MVDTPYKKAWDKFRSTDDWESYCDTASIGLTIYWRIYLENRIQGAFEAGWNAAIDAAQQSERELETV